MQGPRWLQTEWPSQRVFVTSLTEELSTGRFVGPEVAQRAQGARPGIDLSKGEFPFLAVRRRSRA